MYGHQFLMVHTTTNLKLDDTMEEKWNGSFDWGVVLRQSYSIVFAAIASRVLTKTKINC